MKQFNLAFRYHSPIRPDKHITIEAEDESTAIENAIIKLSKSGVPFNDTGYNEIPFSVK